MVSRLENKAQFSFFLGVEAHFRLGKLPREARQDPRAQIKLVNPLKHQFCLFVSPTFVQNNQREFPFKGARCIPLTIPSAAAQSDPTFQTAQLTIL
jgi:hypothetical protein